MRTAGPAWLGHLNNTPERARADVSLPERVRGLLTLVQMDRVVRGEMANDWGFSSQTNGAHLRCLAIRRNTSMVSFSGESYMNLLTGGSYGRE